MIIIIDLCNTVYERGVGVMGTRYTDRSWTWLTCLYTTLKVDTYCLDGRCLMMPVDIL